MKYKPKMQIAQHQWQQNYINAENFLYENTKENVIVGSSLGNRILSDSLKSTYNLSFSGQGIFDGLAIIKKSKCLPKRILIEINVLLRAQNKIFTESITNSISYNLRAIFPVLRDGKQPLAVMAVPLTKTLDFCYKRPAMNEYKNSLDSSIYFEILSSHISEYSVNKTDEINIAINKLNEFIVYFQSKGIEIVFFEMPIDCKLTNLIQPLRIRNKIVANFKAFKIIPQPDCSLYNTSDGIHLDNPSANKYTLYLRRKLDSLNR